MSSYGRSLLPAIAWAAAAILFWSFFKASGEPVHLARGYVPLSLASAVALGVLCVIAAAIAALTVRAARLRSVARTFTTHLVLVVGSIIFGLPFAWLVSTSFKEDRDMASPTGIVWIPRVDMKVPLRDPANPSYETTYQGRTMQGTVSSGTSGIVKFEISHPLVMRGFTIDVPFSSLHPVPSEAPVVTVNEKGTSVEGIVVKNLDDGRRVVKATSPASVAGTMITALPSDVTPVSKTGLRWQNYIDSLEYLPLETDNGLVFLKNTLIIVVLSVIGTILSCAIVAYAFSRLRFPGRDALFLVLLSTMMLPAAVTLLPTFLIFKWLGWVDTLLPLWAPTFFASAFNVFLLRQFFRSVPTELEDSAKIDGCSYMRTFWSVMMPQIKPALAVIGIWTFMNAWNNFMGPLIYINSPEKMPISYAVQLFASDRLAEPELIMAFGTMSMIPVLLLFFFAQRYFIEGVTLSGFGGK